MVEVARAEWCAVVVLVVVVMVAVAVGVDVIVGEGMGQLVLGRVPRAVELLLQCWLRLREGLRLRIGMCVGPMLWSRWLVQQLS